MSEQLAGYGLPVTGPVLVVGFGATGLSVARYLAREGAPFAVTDSRAEPPKAKELAALGEVPHRFGGFESPLPLEEIAEAVVSPGVSLDEPFIRELRDAGIAIIGDIELFARELGPHPADAGTESLSESPITHHPSRLLAVTGSNGKSTVAALVGAMAEAAGLKVAVGGNFGTPALDLLADDVELYVLELSSFQLELTESLAPAAAAVLNLSPDHIDRHRSLERYAAIKARIFRNAGTAVVNADDPIVAAMDTGDAEVVRFSTAADADWHLCSDEARFSPQIHANKRKFKNFVFSYSRLFAFIRGLLAQSPRPTPHATWLCAGGERLCAADEFELRGRHNLGNALAALALGDAIGLPRAAMLTALREFSGLPHRCQWLARVREVDYVDDSKATNVGAMLASLAGIAGPIVLLAGGQAKNADFAPVGSAMAAKGRAAVLFGIDAGRIEAVLTGVVPVHRAANMDDAVQTAAAAAEPGDTVLLSPGCASFDLFRDYRERGERFAAAVGRLST
jgi:UDP-N-acetylmuramoylalanine--D-glutamate ligase